MSVDLKTAIAQVKTAYLISDFIKASGVRLTANGAGKWKGLCVFHNEKTPSFSVSDHFQNFHCFGCGASGDIIKFAMETQNLEFMDALKQLAEDKGIELSLEHNNEEPGIDYKSLRECLRESANFFAREYHKLPSDHKARLQVTDRGLSEKGMVYGYAPEKRTAIYDHLKSKGFSDETMLQAGVVTKWEESGKFSDFWSGRLMFIITDITGKPIGFSGRKLFEDDKRGKFVNSSAGPLFDKSSALFNIQNAKKPSSDVKEVFIAEGQFDVAAFIEAGLPNVVASSGTAFTPQQGSILQRLVGEAGRLVFAFDGDKAGVKAAITVFKNVPSIHSSSWVVRFPETEDPCDLRLAQGNEGFREHVAQRVPLVEFVLNVAKADYDMGSELGRAHYLEYAAKVLKTVASNTVREAFIRKVALDCFTEVSSVKELVGRSSALELGTEGRTTETVAPAESPLALVDSTDILDKIKERKEYALAARFVALALIDPILIQYLPKNKKKLPLEFGTTIDELAALGEGDAIIPEAFTDSRLMNYLSSSRLFPLAHLEGFNTKEQFEYVYKKYMGVVQGAKESEVQSKVLAVLASSDESDQVELLTRALEAEASHMQIKDVDSLGA